MLLPLTTFRPSRIATGEPLGLQAALPSAWAALLVCLGIITIGAALFARRPFVRLGVASVALLAWVLAAGASGQMLLQEATSLARVAPAAGFWTAIFTFSILATDALARLELGPWSRVLALAAAGLVVAAILGTGQWHSLSIMVEYAGRKGVFWTEAGTHLGLAFGSLLAAIVVGVPLGIATNRFRRPGAAVLNVLSLLQTIPSIALFGILIAPLGWVAANVAVAHALGIRGIGAAPAFVALFIYSLLPMVANTAAGLASIPRSVLESATGMGLTRGQRLWSIELPLALPVLLTGVRIVLVQNIGLATIAALIGGGGFGRFVFQGLGQTATDLILLGALPTVALAFVAATTLDAAVDLVQGERL